MTRLQRFQTLAALLVSVVLVPLVRPWLMVPCAAASVFYAYYMWTMPASPRELRRVHMTETDTQRVLRSAKAVWRPQLRAQ